MRPIKVKNGDRICVFKVTANGSPRSGDLDPEPWRTIAVPENATLYKLAEAINEAFEFLFDHPFGFYNNFKEPYRSETGFELFADIGEESEFPGVKKTKIPEAFPDTGAKLLFFFDYGDEWSFPVELIEYRYPQHGKRYPVILEKIGESPEQYPRLEEDGDEMLHITVTAKERDLIISDLYPDYDLAERLKAAKAKNGEISAAITPDELKNLALESLSGLYPENSKNRKKLDELFTKFDKALEENGIELIDEDEEGEDQ